MTVDNPPHCDNRWQIAASYCILPKHAASLARSSSAFHIHTAIACGEGAPLALMTKSLSRTNHDRGKADEDYETEDEDGIDHDDDDGDDDDASNDDSDTLDNNRRKSTYKAQSAGIAWKGVSSTQVPALSLHVNIAIASYPFHDQGRQNPTQTQKPGKTPTPESAEEGSDATARRRGHHFCSCRSKASAVDIMEGCKKMEGTSRRAKGNRCYAPHPLVNVGGRRKKLYHPVSYVPGCRLGRRGDVYCMETRTPSYKVYLSGSAYCEVARGGCKTLRL